MRDIFRISNSWIFLIIYLMSIFTILPFLGYVAQNLIENHHFFSLLVSLLVYGAIGIISLSLAVYVIVSNKPFKIFRLITLVIILVIAIGVLKGIEDPRDKLHIIEYSILAFFIFRVLKLYNSTTALYLWCVVFVGIAGLADEYVQFFIPGRSFSLQDLKIDIFVGSLSELSIALVVRPRLEKWRIRMSFFKNELYDHKRWVENYRMRRDKKE